MRGIRGDALRTLVAGLALVACQGSEPTTGPEAPGAVSYDPAYDVTQLADGGTCPDVYYEQSVTLDNGVEVTWTNVLAGFDYTAGSTWEAEVTWSLSHGSASYVDFTGRPGNSTWTPNGGPDDAVEGTMSPGAPSGESLPVSVTMDPLHAVGSSSGDSWAGAFGNGHFWLLLDVDDGNGDVESVRLGVNVRLEHPEDGFATRCPGADTGTETPPPPPASTHTVGGTVSGLTGTVMLQNNGGDDLPVSANGSFTFATALADGASYEVTVGTQPSGQTCSVSNGSGTIAGADATDVSVLCVDNPPSSTVSYASDIQPYFSSTCTGCHSGSNPPAGVNLESYTQVMASGVVVAGDPDASLIVQQLESGHRNQSTSNIDMIRTWISEGAQNN